MSQHQHDAERIRREQEALAKQYREIGPAALVAALLCAAKKPDAKRAAKQAA